jgi:hypothetical protein
MLNMGRPIPPCIVRGDKVIVLTSSVYKLVFLLITADQVDFHV